MELVVICGRQLSLLFLLGTFRKEDFRSSVSLLLHVLLLGDEELVQCITVVVEALHVINDQLWVYYGALWFVFLATLFGLLVACIGTFSCRSVADIFDLTIDHELQPLLLLTLRLLMGLLVLSALLLRLTGSQPFSRQSLVLLKALF